ncbi:MAG: imidazole glycerol phosphate synthase subunit HisH, partial [Subdoligranulum sp.]|nr:imidazole glycerol phosphate synthase subunit HisH [Subdoligranulum sp.]
MIAIIDYGVGNLFSLASSLKSLGLETKVTRDAAAIRAADHIILPGVGAFADAMAKLEATGLVPVIKQEVEHKPLLGICLGMQLCLERGDEGCAEGQEMEGLGLMRGRIVRMPALAADGSKLKVPHVGWNSVELAAAGNPLFAGVEDGSYFYFTHSYICECSDAADVAGITCHAQPFASALRRGQVFGCQFHPEKSSAAGMRLLANFGRIVEEAWA